MNEQGRMAAAVAVAAGIGLGLGCWALGGSVNVDAKEASLGEVARLLDAQGGPTLAIAPELAAEKVTFAAKGMSAWAALRWLCRTQGLVVTSGKDERLTLARPSPEQSVEKEYNVAKFASTQAASDALVNFIRLGLFPLHPTRAVGGEKPAYDALCERGRLKVLAPPVVHREVVALLRAITKVQPHRGMEDVAVAYAPHEVGLLGERQGGGSPRLTGEVTLELANASATEAATALTAAAKMSFFVDPWDEGLKAARVTLRAQKQALGDVANQLARQLGSERCWHDEAWLFVKQDRRPIFESFVMRAYNITGLGAEWVALTDAYRALIKTQQAWRKDLPFAIERADDLLLVCGPAAWHEGLENFTRHILGPGGREIHRKRR